MAVPAEFAERGRDGVAGFVALDDAGVYVRDPGDGGRVAQVLGYLPDHAGDGALGRYGG